MRGHKKANASNEAGLKQYWRDMIKLADAYIKFKYEFIEMLTDFKSVGTVTCAKLVAKNMKTS